MRKIAIYSALVLPLAFIDASTAFAQDGSRIVMRRPINDAGIASPSGPTPPTPPAACGTPGNPCVSSCTYSEPYWDYSTTDPSVCTGSTGYANATCMALNESGSVIAVPDSVCLENVTSYQNRCGNFSGMPGSGPVAGPRPETAPGSMDCTASGVPVVISIGEPRVAYGSKGSDGIWRISGYNAGSIPVCSYPTAAPAVVECRVNGVRSDSSKCSVESYSQLYNQNLVPISEGGNAPSDIRAAQWVRPGYELEKCETQWSYTDNPTPQGCGEVTVTRDISCIATNAQSANIPEEELSCDPSTRPDDSFTTTNYENCSYFTGSKNGLGEASESCGEYYRDQLVGCYRSDDSSMEDPVSLSLPECRTAIDSRCSPRSNIECLSESEFFVTERHSFEGPNCYAGVPEGYEWRESGRGSPSATCGRSQTPLIYSCFDADGNVVSDDFCTDPKPASSIETIESSSCTGVDFCGSGSVITAFSDGSNVDRSGDCSSAGASCMEQIRITDGGSTSYLSRCMSATVQNGPDGVNPLEVRGADYTFETSSEGWCDYDTSPSGLHCLLGASEITPSTGHCNAWQGPRVYYVQDPTQKSFDEDSAGGICTNYNRADCVGKPESQGSDPYTNYMDYGYAEFSVIYNGAVRYLNSGFINNNRAVSSGKCVGKDGGTIGNCSTVGGVTSSSVSMTLGGVTYTLNTSFSGNTAVIATVTQSGTGNTGLCTSGETVGLEQKCTDIGGGVEMCNDRKYYKDTSQCAGYMTQSQSCS